MLTAQECLIRARCAEALSFGSPKQKQANMWWRTAEAWRKRAAELARNEN